MKILYIVRHAKSSWEDSELMDDERPLLRKGEKRTKKVIAFLLEKGIQVDVIKSSHAVRAFETAKIIARALKYPVENIMIDRQIYHAGSGQLLEQFFDLSDSINSLMFVGHNPTVTNFANYFIKPQIDWLPTSGIISISFFTDFWGKITEVKNKTNFVIYPKML